MTASTLPRERVTIRFPVTEDEESYQLLELPADILKAVEGGATVPLVIKGRPSDDAVLCTDNKTYTLRTVSISNSLVVLRPPAGHHQELHIRDIRHEVLECVPSAGRVERVRTVLKDSAWRGLGAELWATPLKAGTKRKREGKRYTRQQLSSIIQASEEELARALKTNSVVEVDGHMLLLPPVELSALLALVLALLTITGGTSNDGVITAPAAEIIDTLASDHDVPHDLSRGVQDLFGEVDGETWRCDAKAVVRELGRGLLVALKTTPRPSDEFLAAWREQCGETFADLVSLDLLTGDFILRDPPPSAFADPCPLISYFPTHALPLNPANRFSDLFLTRQRWRPDEMEPFLRGLYPDGDSKARDKLVAKFVRVVKEREGSWWYPRRTG